MWFGQGGDQEGFPGVFNILGESSRMKDKVRWDR